MNPPSSHPSKLRISVSSENFTINWLGLEADTVICIQSKQKRENRTSSGSCCIDFSYIRRELDSRGLVVACLLKTEYHRFVGADRLIAPSPNMVPPSWSSLHWKLKPSECDRYIFLWMRRFLGTALFVCAVLGTLRTLFSVHHYTLSFLLWCVLHYSTTALWGHIKWTQTET